MCYHIDFKQLDPVTARILQRKLTLEERIKGPLRTYFRRIVRDFRIAFGTSGRAINVEQYNGELEVILRRHYERVQREFRDTVGEQNGGKHFLAYCLKQTDDEQRRLNELIDISLLAWQHDTIARKLTFISATNDIQMLDAIEKARQALLDDNMPVDNRSVAMVASRLLMGMFEARVDRIATSETQDAAEGTNQIVATALAGAVPFTATGIQGIQPAVEPREVTKSWRDMDDNRVRMSHRRVDGTTLPENGIFTVGGSRLRFPGDTSLGAAIGQIINCRCFADYRIAA